jgi:hypothetical protein
MSFSSTILLSTKTELLLVIEYVFIHHQRFKYRTNNGQVVYELDLCSHRSIPVSLGQIEKEENENQQMVT